MYSLPLPSKQDPERAVGAKAYPYHRCHTFDERADGYGRAEGIGALYLKRLSDAIKDKDVIR